MWETVFEEPTRHYDEHALDALMRASEFDPSSAEARKHLVTAQVNALLSVEGTVRMLKVEVANLAYQFGRVADEMQERREK